VQKVFIVAEKRETLTAEEWSVDQQMLSKLKEQYKRERHRDTKSATGSGHISDSKSFVPCDRQPIPLWMQLISTQLIALSSLYIRPFPFIICCQLRVVTCKVINEFSRDIWNDRHCHCKAENETCNSCQDLSFVKTVWCSC